jgi:hypothetical protein
VVLAELKTLRLKAVGYTLVVAVVVETRLMGQAQMVLVAVEDQVATKVVLVPLQEPAVLAVMVHYG